MREGFRNVKIFNKLYIKPSICKEFDIKEIGKKSRHMLLSLTKNNKFPKRGQTILLFWRMFNYLQSISIYLANLMMCLLVNSWWSVESGFGDKLQDWTSDNWIFGIPRRCYRLFSKQLEVHNKIITKQMNRAGKSWQIGIFQPR